MLGVKHYLYIFYIENYQHIFNKNKKSNYFSKYSALIFEENIKFILPFFYVSENSVNDYFLLHNISLKPIFTKNLCRV